LLPSGEPGEKVISEIFLDGTGPRVVSNIANFRRLRDQALASNIQGALEEMTGRVAGSGLNNELNLDLNLDIGTDNSPKDLNLLN
jgi:hypothetical protein